MDLVPLSSRYGSCATVHCPAGMDPVPLSNRYRSGTTVYKVKGSLFIR
jgi:hypothetical protein